MHPQALLGDRLETRATRRGTDVRVELQSLGDERGAACVQLSQIALRGNAEAAPQNDAQRDDEETEQQEGDAKSPDPAPYSALRHARSLALRARGLWAVSSWGATMARRVTTLPSA